MSVWPYLYADHMHLDKCKPKEYLNSVGIEVSLSDKLYNMVETSFLDAKFNALGIVLEIKDESLSLHFSHGKKINPASKEEESKEL